MQRRAFLLTFRTGNEVAHLGLDPGARGIRAVGPLAGAAHQLPRSGERADILVEVDPGQAAALDAAVVFFPCPDPFVGQAADLSCARRWRPRWLSLMANR